MIYLAFYKQIYIISGISLFNKSPYSELFIAFFRKCLKFHYIIKKLYNIAIKNLFFTHI